MAKSYLIFGANKNVKKSMFLKFNLVNCMNSTDVSLVAIELEFNKIVAYRFDDECISPVR